MRYRQSVLEKAFHEYKDRKCKACQYNLYCNVINNGESSKAQFIHKGKGKVSCENFKPRYMTRVEL